MNMRIFLLLAIVAATAACTEPEGATQCSSAAECGECGECRNGLCFFVASCVPDAGVDAGVSRPDAEVMDAAAPDAEARVAALASGLSEYHTCALLEDKQVKCWGTNRSGVFGVDDLVILEPKLVPGLSDVDQVVVGTNFTCALIEQEVYCLGSNIKGELGVGIETASSKVPLKVSGLEDIVQIAAGTDHVCALRSDGAVFCWGHVFYEEDIRWYPVDMFFPANTKQIVGGSGRVGGIDEDGKLWGAGLAHCHRLGIGTEQMQFSAVEIPVPEKVIAASFGDVHGCAISETNALYCWGCNGSGMIGDGTAENRPLPVKVLPQSVEHVAAGFRNTCIRLFDESVWCWGERTYGIMPDGFPPLFEARASPTRMVPFPPDSTIQLYWYYGCSFSSGSVQCWGLARHGTLGPGIMNDSSVPILVIE
jgi:alpha-tubulin suppressor-like RCC1 family protein